MTSGRVAPLVVSVPEEAYARPLAALDGVEAVVWPMDGPAPRSGELRLVVPPYQRAVPLAERLAGLPRLEVVQLLTAGFDHVRDDVPEGVVLCNAVGVHDASTAELAVALLLASLRHLPEFARDQSEGRWASQRIWPALADRRVLVVGYGGVGRAIARRLAPFEVTVTAVASRARAGDELVPRVHGIAELAELVGSHDAVVLAVPLTERTRGLIDAGLLARLRDGSVVVNVARGPVVDTEALRAECATGRLRAALDVTDPEPLPPDHPLWRTPGVLVSPHVGGATTAMRPRAERLLVAQVRALLEGRPLHHVVGPAGG